MTLLAETRTSHCAECDGAIIASDGTEEHDHQPSCSHWWKRCWICQTPFAGRGSVPAHEDHEELCFWCGDQLAVESHP